ncbi:UNVERIFIED_CONTAM: hypothetical protein K2H54_062292 [Gekko kuhli]
MMGEALGWPVAVAPQEVQAWPVVVEDETLGRLALVPTQTLGWGAVAAVKEAQARAAVPEEEVLGRPLAVPTQTLGWAAAVEEELDIWYDYALVCNLIY